MQKTIELTEANLTLAFREFAQKHDHQASTLVVGSDLEQAAMILQESALRQCRSVLDHSCAPLWDIAFRTEGPSSAWDLDLDKGTNEDDHAD